MNRILGLTLAVLCVVALPVVAQSDEGAAAEGVPDEAVSALAEFGLGLGVGVTSFSDVDPLSGLLETTAYQKISLSPDLALGKFGIGLDVTFHVDFNGGPTGDQYLRTEDWVPDTTGLTTGQAIAAFAELYLGKFRYIRWGLKGDPLYIKFGMIDDGLLGNGFIMGNYANTLFLPERRILGLSFDLDGALFSFPLLGLETFVGNLARFDVVGARLFFRPLVYTSVPILKNLMVGLSMGLDRNPFLYGDGIDDGTNETAPPVGVFGLDVNQPILTNPVISLSAYGDAALLTTAGNGGVNAGGGMVGLGGRLFSVVTYGAQVRILGPNFIPVYFDPTYDLARAEKYRLLADGVDVPAFAGWLASLGFSFMEDNISFRASVDGPFRAPALDALGLPLEDNYLNWPHLRGVFRIQGDFMKGFGVSASYDKKGIMTFGDLISAEDAVIQARIDYKTGPAVIAFVYNLKYLATPPASDPDKKWEVTSGLETSIQLF